MRADGMTGSTGHAIELRAVDKRYGKTAVVDGVDLQVHDGECFVLIGHNGAGKTEPCAGKEQAPAVCGNRGGLRTHTAL